MHPYRSNNSPRWLIILAGLLVIGGGYYVLRGFASFVETGGTGISVTREPQTGTSALPPTDQPIGTLDFLNGTPLSGQARICKDFKVKVARARIRECPNETCDTRDSLTQGAIVCVYGVVKDATDWYEVNPDPKDPVIALGYMHKSVIAPANPTSTPMPTLNLPTVTPAPTNTIRPVLVPATVDPGSP